MTNELLTTYIEKRRELLEDHFADCNEKLNDPFADPALIEELNKVEGSLEVLDEIESVLSLKDKKVSAIILRHEYQDYPEYTVKAEEMIQIISTCINDYNNIVKTDSFTIFTNCEGYEIIKKNKKIFELALVFLIDGDESLYNNLFTTKSFYRL